ncbi:hypothetical protein [Acinetobacter sp. ANC 3813]|uniref:hypothetical protein n=1 Tax=Acinetobacter sp. ANC 3813 TaxID=1977873 RepID=UPI000A3523E5|nr:hypothetical protein [Acinetobacter sp. ANC 3813]OTG90735.1 hypothetical protein B9T34_04995 [Acinetobacter sp. ANC 3813]
MMGHQRDIMAALGIDLWIPKDAMCLQHQPAIWRDQAPAEVISEIILQQTSDVADLIAQQPELAPVERVNSLDIQPKLAEAPVIVQEPIVPALQIPAFSIEAIVLAKAVVLIDSTAVTADQQLLWRNIQRAVSAEFYQLQWPFAWQNMQDGRGAASYVQGFSDALSADKNVLCLGDIPHLQSSSSIRLASLQEMLDQPLLKKRLWQFMQNKIKE